MTSQEAASPVDTEPSDPMLVIVNQEQRGHWHFGSDGNIWPALRA